MGPENLPEIRIRNPWVEVEMQLPWGNETVQKTTKGAIYIKGGHRIILTEKGPGTDRFGRQGGDIKIGKILVLVDKGEDNCGEVTQRFGSGDKEVGEGGNKEDG